MHRCKCTWAHIPTWHHRQTMSIGQVGYLEPFRYASQSRRIRLHDVHSAHGNEVRKVTKRIELLSQGYGRIYGAREANVAEQVLKPKRSSTKPHRNRSSRLPIDVQGRTARSNLPFASTINFLSEPIASRTAAILLLST